MKRSALLGLMAAMTVAGAMAQRWHEGDIQWIKSSEFASNVEKWNASHKLSEDDNFFISRVRPKLRFRNTATQIRENLQEGVNDRRLVAWLPFNIHDGNQANPDSRDALPSGVFDSECFTMWNYVDHWGDWTAPMGQIPGGLSDIAHKNGVGVSSVASIPFGPITAEWKSALDAIGKMGTDATAKKAADMLSFYGHDGLGYNSEFSGYYSLGNLRNFHQYLLTNLKANYNTVLPGYNMQENIWYDGTNDSGSIQFDAGLGGHNYRNWGPSGQERSSLFLNYNWVMSAGNTATLKKCVDNAASNTYGKGRSPLYLYCGLNMQGGEPSPARDPWTAFSQYNLSIGLWGQHRINMFFEGRGSNGTSPEAQQTTYQSRIENWFTGGSHNPVNVPTKLSGATTCATDDKSFHGMSTFMSARSTLSWDLSKEAFVTYFNVGNGKFFNYRGERQHNNEWYNIASQDFMPTWRWWFNGKFLGKNAADVAADGLKANITWDDAYVGGSTVRVSGTNAADEYLHLFKTAYELKAGDEIKFTYKLAAGSSEIALVASVNGAESTVAAEIPVCDSSVLSDNTEWITKTYTVAEGDGLAGQTLALLGLKFANTSNLDLLLGELSVKRGELAAPVTPEITKVEVLRSHYAGLDAKIIFNVPNDKPAGTVCYNDDVNTSFFKIWAREEGKDPVLMGTTTSWAAMSYSTPFEGDENGVGKIAFGVEAVSMDHKTSSPIVWSDFISSGERIYSDQVTVNKATITPGEEFVVSAVDPKRSFKWEIWTAGDNSTKVAESGEAVNAWTCPGIATMGTYDVRCIGANNTGAESIDYKNMLVITDPKAGRLPQIETLTANGSEANIEVVSGADVTLEYTGRSADGVASRGIKLDEKFFGVRASEVFTGDFESFSLAGWLRVDNLPGDCAWIDVRNPGGKWPRNNWGWLWTNIKKDGTLMDFHHDMSVADAGAITNPLVYDFNNGKTTFFNPGQWTHFAFTFDRDESKTRTVIYINGKKIESKWYYFTGTNDDFIADPNNTDKTPAQTGTTDDYVNAAKRMALENYLSIGGTRHTGRGGGLGLTGVLDDFQVWNRAMTQEDVNLSLAGLDGNNLPEGVTAYWDFESAPGTDGAFIAKGSKAGAKAGYYRLGSGTAEGEGVPVNIAPTFTSGCPFIPGSDYKIETKPSVTTNKATITDLKGNDKAGSAIIRYAQGGDYTATVTLRNDLGSDSRTFQVIKVTGGGAAVEGIGAEDVKVYTVGDTFYLDVTEGGNYNVAIYAADGRTVANVSRQVASGDMMKVNLNGATGVYVVKIARDGKTLRTVKVQK